MKDPQIKYKNRIEADVQTFWQKRKHEIWLTLAILALIFGVGLWYSNHTPTQPTITKDKQIIKQVEQDIKAPVAKADSFKRLVTDSAKVLKTLEQKLYAAQQENKRLKANLGVRNFAASSETPDSTASQLAAEYTQDLALSAGNSDSLCNLTVNNLHSQLDNKDSIITQTELQRDIFKHGFNEMAANSQAKDKAIKDLNKKLRVKKVTGVVKSLAIVAGIVYVLVKK